MRSQVLSKRGYTGPICTRARPLHVFQASQANAKIGLSDQRHESRRRHTRVLEGRVGRGKEGDMHTRSLTPSNAMDAASSALEHNLSMWFGIGQQ